jgi:hypothetical protein
VDISTISIALDMEKNIKVKPNCGFYLSRDAAYQAVDRFAGVYSVVYPSIHHGAKSDKYILSTMRIVHALDLESGASVIRVKLNVPNVKDDREFSRYQYRGYLNPISYEVNAANAQHWNVLLHLLQRTINREEILGEEIPDEDVIQLVLTRPNHIDTFTGLLTSISQRVNDTQDIRIPYAVRVLVQKQYNAKDDEGVEFMKRKARLHDTLDSLCQDLRSNSDVTKNYFRRADNLGSACYLTTNHVYKRTEGV